MTVVLSKPKTPNTDPAIIIKEKEKPVLSFTEQNEFNQQSNKNKKKVKSFMDCKHTRAI